MTETQFKNEAVADLWFRWIETVRRIVDPRSAGRKISPQDYRNLHNSLVKGCRSSDTTDEDLLDKLQQVKRIVAPWVTYDSLASADRRFLSDVLKQAEPISVALKSQATTTHAKNFSQSKNRRGKWLVWPLTCRFATNSNG